MTLDPNKILRLHIPQWQGGDVPGYNVGGRILAAIAPESTGPVATVSVPPASGAARTEEAGILSRSAVLAQAHEARDQIARHAPDAIVTLGGDCLVSLAPFAYLNAKYGDDLAVLWVDAHPDIMGPAQYNHAHAHAMAALMGKGDADLAALATRPVTPGQVLYVGLNQPGEWEAQFIAERGMAVLGPDALAANPDAVSDWLKASGKSKAVIHFDLDVLDPRYYDFLYFRDPDAPQGAFDAIAQGRMTMPQILDIFARVEAQVQTVGLTVAEYLPWSAIKLAQMMASLPLLKSKV